MSTPNKTINASSEIGILKRVLVHRPDDGIDRISPKRAEELLFDDIVHLPQMREEHDVFTDILKVFLGEENVIETADLLLEALEYTSKNIPSKKQELIDKIVSYEELPTRDKEFLEQLSNKDLTDLLITGHREDADHILFDPIPNFIFTRDIAVTVNDHVIITKAAKEARFRENLLTRFIFWAHPEFEHLGQEGRIINLNNIDEFPPSRKGEHISIEGGDMMIIDKDYLLVGCSERTTSYAIDSLKEVLFKKGVVKNVVQINISSERSWMHIDTLFTQINHDDVVAYKPIVIEGKGANVIVHSHSQTSRTYPSVLEFMHSELNGKMNFIEAGNGLSPYQEREQWTDGCNLVTLKPGVALTYDRNPHTEIAFKNAGYQVIHARDLLKKIKSGKIKAEEVEKTIITLPSNELSRARGGSHCMTCPIQRI